MTDLTVYAHEWRADVARQLLGAACRATASTARLELYGSGSLYQRLGPRHGPPSPDVVLWFGPFAASAAAADGLLQPYQPARVGNGQTPHAPDWTWTTLDFSAIALVGAPALSNWTDVASVPRLAIADPERSEVGLAILLASLDRARQLDADAERGWNWWQERARAGLLLAADEQAAVALVHAGKATHALTLSRGAVPLAGLAPIPHAVGLPGSSRNVDSARRILDWMTSETAGATLSLSAWQATSNGLAALLQAAPPLDVDWAREQYSLARRRWARSGFGPTPGV